MSFKQLKNRSESLEIRLNDISAALKMEKAENYVLKAENSRLKALAESAERNIDRKNSEKQPEIGGNKYGFADKNSADRLIAENRTNDAKNTNGVCADVIFSENSARITAEKLGAESVGAEANGREEARAAQRINLEMNRLRMFVLKWQAAFAGGDAKKNYAKSSALVGALKSLTENATINEFNLDRAAERMLETEKIIAAPYAALSDGACADDGFNMDEVLNPTKDLDLEKLCKELGVME